MRAGDVVGEGGARGVGVVHREESADLVIAGTFVIGAPVTGGHRQQVLHRQRGEFRGRMRRGQVGEEVHHPVADLQQALLHGKPDGRRRPGLGIGIHRVLELGRVGIPPMLGDHLVVAQDHNAVDLVAALVEGAEKVGDGLGTDALGLRRAARQAVRPGIRGALAHRGQAEECGNPRKKKSFHMQGE